MTIGWEILEVGEKALVYSHSGQASVKDGPQRIFLWREKFKKLNRYAVNQNQYLVVRFVNGNVEHIRGPHVKFLNPIVHESIRIHDCQSLDANEALVVYKQTDKSMERLVVYGPTLFMPAANEWLHKFVWHGTDPKSKTKMLPDAHHFSVLKIIPDQFYYNVDEVRTSDDALLRVKLMIFYELTDVEMMLDSTKDPMADFINCLCADVVAFASSRTYMTFINESDLLNELSSYPQLLERCEAIGYSVTKVVFRGYFTHERLQKMHDWAIEKRTNLKIELERESQQQEMIDLNLKNDMERMELEQKMELEELKHQQQMELAKQTHTLLMEKRIHDDKLAKCKKNMQSQLNTKNRELCSKEHYLKKLKGLDVNLTQHLMKEKHLPESVTQIVAPDNSMVVHLHHNAQKDGIF